MTWVNITIVVIFAAGLVVTIGSVWQRSSQLRRALIVGLRTLDEEEKRKQEILAEVSELMTGLSSTAEFEEAKQRFTAKEEQARSERGRVTIAEAEHETLETRLREMGEVERELEASHVEAEREVEMLRTQEKELENRRNQVKTQLEVTIAEVDSLLEKLDQSIAEHEHVVRAKAQLAQTQEKIEWYTEQIGTLNRQYLDLKRAYDALDIEYAQLYEKQNELETAKVGEKSA